MRNLLVLLYILTLLPIGSKVFSQSTNNFDKVWVQGGGISFTTTFTSNGPVNQYLDTFYSPYFVGGNSNICDSFGNLLLCSDGFNIYNNQTTTIDGGDTLVAQNLFILKNGFSNIAQSSIFLPMDNGKYYFITPTASDYEVNKYWIPDTGRNLFDQILYNVIDMHANGGAGKVVKRKVPLLENVLLSKTQMMACKHSDGKSWWIFKQAHDTNLIYKFLFTQDSIYGPYIQGFVEPHFTQVDQIGQSVFSQDGTKYATICRGSHQLFVADFDRCYGTLTNPKIYDVPLQVYASDSNYNDETHGLAFSPSGKYIYVNGFTNVQQIDLQDANPQNSWTFVGGIDTSLAVFQEYSTMSLGHDNKIYIGNFGGLLSQMSVINSPDNKGTACNFCPKCLRFPKFQFNPQTLGGGVTNPPCMPNYRLGKASGFCWPAIVPMVTQSPKGYFSFYPNPASDHIFVSTDVNGDFVLSDLTGKAMMYRKISGGINTNIELYDISSGMYLYKFITSSGILSSGKIIIVH